VSVKKKWNTSIFFIIVQKLNEMETYKLIDCFLIGKSGMVWPGLNQLALKDKQVLKIHKQTPNQEHFDNIIKIRSKKDTVFRRLSIPALLRGWTGRGMAGMSCGAPDPIGDCK
jgi:hypothetical protein